LAGLSPCALASFPTRRSSDLSWGSLGGTRSRGAARWDGPLATATGQERRGGRGPWGYRGSPGVLVVPRVPSRPPLAPGGHLRPRDRKSTRLNSSHVSISYAVF